MAARHIARITTILIAVFAISACGSGSNNDQGNSFLFNGFKFIEGTFPSCSTSPEAQYLTGVYATLNRDSGSSSCFFSSNPFTVSSGVEFINLLATQRVRLQNLVCSYNVLEAPGASIPSQVFILSGATIDDTNDSGGANVPEVVTLIADLMNEDTFQYLNNNGSLFPEPPFNVQVTCEATGITSAGNTLVSNPASLNVTIIEQSEFFDVAVQTPAQTGTTGEGGVTQTTTTSPDVASDDAVSDSADSIELEADDGVVS